jgi:hypothetical protein
MRRLNQALQRAEESLRSHRMSGLTPNQLDEVVARVARQLEESGKPWNKGTGRSRELPLREGVIATCAYLRQNIIEDVLAEIFGVSQPTISRTICDLTPIIAEITDEFRPTVEDATTAVRKQGSVLVDGFLAPCWSWHLVRELWSGKHKTTGHNCQVITDYAGNVIYISEPMTGTTMTRPCLSRPEPPTSSKKRPAGSETRDTLDSYTIIIDLETTVGARPNADLPHS